MRQGLVAVFPTHVGVNRHLARRNVPHHRLPHARGGEPTSPTCSRAAVTSSPRTWG